MHFLPGIALVCALAIASPALGGVASELADETLEGLENLSRAADRANARFLDALNGGGDSRHYEREWHAHEARLERERTQVLAKKAGVSEEKIRTMRTEGMGWADIARHYHLDPACVGYGASRNDPQRDNWRGTPPSHDWSHESPGHGRGSHNSGHYGR